MHFLGSADLSCLVQLPRLQAQVQTTADALNDFICAVAPPAHHILLPSWSLFEEDRKGATIFKDEMWREALLITSVDLVVMVVRGRGGI